MSPCNIILGLTNIQLLPHAQSIESEPLILVLYVDHNPFLKQTFLFYLPHFLIFYSKTSE